MIESATNTLRVNWSQAVSVEINSGDGLMAVETLLGEILKLPVDERAELARRVLLSLEPNEFGDDAEQAWMEEIQRRREAIRSGDAQLMDWGDVRRQIFPIETHPVSSDNSSS